jgi:hypothetical protein
MKFFYPTRRYATPSPVRGGLGRGLFSQSRSLSLPKVAPSASSGAAHTNPFVNS